MVKKADKPKELKPWDRRPWPGKGTKSLPKLYAAIGRALSQWERYEHALAHLFATLVTDSYVLPAERAYSAVRTFEGRADMLRAASEAYFALWPNEKLLGDYKAILKNATSFSLRRNDIAHGVVDHFERLPYPPRSKLGGRRRRSFGLYPSSAAFKGRDLGGAPDYCYAAVELDFFCEEFQKLSQPAMNLAAYLIGNRRTQEALKDRRLREHIRARYHKPTNPTSSQTDRQ